MHVFQTGGTGFIGQPLTKSLLGRGWNVTALVRNPEGASARALSRMGANLAAGDVINRESMRAPMKAADLVVHNAGHYEMGVDDAGKQRMQRVNVDGTENVLSLACELSIPRTVYVSTVQSFGETGQVLRDETFIREVPPRTVYERTKTDAHEIAREYQRRGLPLVIVCPHGVVGPNDHSVLGYMARLYVNRILPPIACSPDMKANFVALDDLVEGITLAAEKGRSGETYILSGELGTYRKMFDSWSKKPGRFAIRYYLPEKVLAALFTPLEPIQRWLGLPAFFSRETVKMGSTNWYYSNAKAKLELGYSARSAEQMWKETIEGEIALLAQRKGQSLVERLKPLEPLDE